VTKFGRARRAWRARRDEQGATIVEAAIIIPLLVLLTFGAIEFGIGFRDSAAVAGSTRAGARIASALTGDSSFANNTQLSVGDSLKDLLHADPQSLTIYKADSNGNPFGGFGSCSDCFTYTWDAGSKTWSGPTGDPWTVAEQKTQVCGGALPAVGVRVLAKQSFITNLFGAGKNFDHKTVMRLEPISSDQC
jgi:hypothetical protein